MKKLAVPAAILAVLLACDGPGGKNGVRPEDTAVDTGTAPHDIEDPGTHGMGTQVGSEGFWNCPIDTATAVAGDQQVPALGGSTPADVAAARIGPWSLEIVSAGTTGSSPGDLTLSDAGQYYWVTVEPTAACTDHLAIGVSGSLSRVASTTDPLFGWLAVRPGEGLVILTNETDLTGLQASWGPPPTVPVGTSQFRVEARIDEVRIDGTAAWADCVDIDCTTTDVLATLTGAR
jgi:hypothetical protein